MSRAVPSKTDAIRQVLKPVWAPTQEELQPKVEKRLKQIVGRQRLYALLVQMQLAGEIGIVGRAAHRRYVLITGRK